LSAWLTFANSSPGDSSRVSTKPAQPIDGLAGRTVLAANPTAITDLIEKIEQVRIAELSGIRLVAFGDARHLHVSAPGGVLAELHGQITLHDLHVITIHLHSEVRRADLFQNCVGLRLGIEIEARHVAGVDGLDQEGDAVARELGGGVLEVGNIGGVNGRGNGARRLARLRPLEGGPGKVQDAPAAAGTRLGLC